MVFQCPHCQGRISFFSRAVHGWRRRQTCPHCEQPIRQTLNFSRFFILAFMVGFPIKMLGVMSDALATPEAVAREATRVLDAYGPGDTGHVFNLGHGISQFTPPDNVAALVETVHAYRRKAA